MPGKRGRPAVGKEKVQVYLPADLYRRVHERAKKGYRSLSDQVWMMLDIAEKHMEGEEK